MNQFCKKSGQVWRCVVAAVSLLFLCLPGPAQANIPRGQGQPYTLQAEDTLAKLAVKYFDDLAAWPAILIATRAKAIEDSRYRRIYEPQDLRPGELLWIPDPEQVTNLLAIEAERPELQPLTNEMGTEWAAYVEAKRVLYDIPGAAVVLVSGNEVLLAQGFGERELGSGQPVTPETLFPVGSTTKALNATLIARLVDQGYLGWDQPVLDIWPDFALSDLAHTQQLQLRHLLNMQSGLPRRDLAWSGANLTAEELLETLDELPLYNRIGEQYYYNNQMVAAGGYLATIAAGGQVGNLEAAYAGLLQSQVFDPVGMTSTTTDLEMARATPNRATPHDLDLYGQITPVQYHEDRSILPAGGVYANALDMARLVQVHLNEGITAEGQRLVSAHNIRETQRPQTYISPRLSYGLGWFIEDFRGVDLIWHDGDVLGVKALIGFIPEADLGVVILSNRSISLVFNSGAFYRLMEILYDLPDPKAEEIYDDIWANFQRNSANILASGVSPSVDPAALAKFVGAYEEGWQVELRGDRLFVTRGPYEWHVLDTPGETFVVNNGYGIGMTLYLEEDETTGTPVLSFTLSTGEPGVYEKVESN